MKGKSMLFYGKTTKVLIAIAVVLALIILYGVLTHEKPLTPEQEKCVEETFYALALTQDVESMYAECLKGGSEETCQNKINKLFSEKAESICRKEIK
jgi:hypothetical protein